MAHFEFVTLWQFKAALKPIWDCIFDSGQWPEWWKGVERVDVIREGRPDSVGKCTKQVWKSALPYRLRFDIEVTRIEPMKVIEVASRGELSGVGIMSFSTQGDDVTVRFDWRVDTTTWWMNLIAPVAAPLFRWNHGVIMDWGAQCMADRLHVKLLQTPQN